MFLSLPYVNLPQYGVKDQCDDADANSAPGIATSSSEDAKVDRKRLRILLRTGSIAPKPYAVAANEYAEEDECLEADVVQISGELGSIAHANHDDSRDDHDDAKATKNLGPTLHHSLVNSSRLLGMNILLVEQRHDDEEADEDGTQNTPGCTGRPVEYHQAVASR